jgi:predicted nucleic acid-binding protein
VKVFLDTNVWVSAFAGAGLCEDLLANTVRHHELLASPLVWEELTRVLEQKLGLMAGERDEAKRLFSAARLIKDAPKSLGDNDARLVAAASAAGAECFVTGDRAILKREKAGAMRIVTPREAWIILFAAGNAH